MSRWIQLAATVQGKSRGPWPLLASHLMAKKELHQICGVRRFRQPGFYLPQGLNEQMVSEFWSKFPLPPGTRRGDSAGLTEKAMLGHLRR
jgi:hypothetical protein